MSNTTNLSYQFYSLLWRQRWLRKLLGKTLYKQICKHGPAPDAAFSADFFGIEYEGNLQNTIEFSIYYYGAFEKPLLFFLRDCICALSKQNTVFLDVGANIGQHSLFMSRNVTQVHAFEPYQKVRDRLLHHVALNQIQNLHVYDVGLSDKYETLDFYAPTGRNEGIGSFDAETTSKGNRNIGQLALVKGDDFLQKQGIQHVDLIKIDVEGFEKSVLNGLRDTLDQHRPIVVVEITYGKSLSLGSMDELQGLFPRDYEFFTFDTRKPDGSKARRQGARAKRSGLYRLIPFRFLLQSGQDDVVCCPREEINKLPLKNL